MLTLSPHRRERLRKLGVEPDLPKIPGARHERGELHLSTRCGAPQEIEILEAWTVPCGWCHSVRATLPPEVLDAVAELEDLDTLVEEVEMLEWTARANSAPEVAHPSVPGLVSALEASRKLLLERLPGLRRKQWTSRAADVLHDRTKAAADAVCELLGTERGKRVLSQHLQHQLGPVRWDRSHDAVLVHVGHLPDQGLAVGAAYGRSLCERRLLVQGPVQALAYMAKNTTSLPLHVGDEPDEVLQTLAALWEPASTGPLGAGETLLEAARAVTP